MSRLCRTGLDATVATLFRNHGISGLEIYASNLILDESGQVTIRSPHSNPDCGKCGTCKLDILRKFRADYDKIILIGDGESDRHAAKEADMVLALHRPVRLLRRSGDTGSKN